MICFFAFGEMSWLLFGGLRYNVTVAVGGEGGRQAGSRGDSVNVVQL